MTIRRRDLLEGAQLQRMQASACMLSVTSSLAISSWIQDGKDCISRRSIYTLTNGNCLPLFCTGMVEGHTDKHHDSLILGRLLVTNISYYLKAHPVHVRSSPRTQSRDISWSPNVENATSTNFSKMATLAHFVVGQATDRNGGPASFLSMGPTATWL